MAEAFGVMPLKKARHVRLSGRIITAPATNYFGSSSPFG